MQNLSAAYFSLAGDLLDEGKMPEALSAMQRSYDIVEPIAAGDPKNALFQKSMAVKNLGLCRVIRQMGHAQQALPYCQQGLASLEKLSAADPGSGDKRLAVADAQRQLAETQIVAGDTSATVAKKRQ